MAARSLASLTLSFGLVNIPVKLYSATETSGTVRFNLLAKDGSRLRQQYVSDQDGKVVERADMVKGYEFEKDRFVLFTSEELKALDEAANHVIDIVAFVPEKSVDPIYYDKAYFLAPDKRGGKPYALLAEAMRESGRCALARWTWKGKQYVVQVRTAEDGLVLQQLLYAEEVRSLKDLGIEHVDVTRGELTLALQLIDQIARDEYDPTEFKDEEKQRVLKAIDEKIAGKQVVASAHAEAAPSGQVIDLMDALRASLGHKPGKAAPETAAPAPVAELKERKAARRAPKAEEPVAAPARATRARK
ncbi:MAG: Ku protein [Proteobacteria bacterium]|nr:Ku protein [Pseudomonadota bacterium]